MIMIFDELNYIHLPSKTGNIETDAKNLLMQNEKENTFVHVINVARVNGNIAELFGLDKNKCIVSGLLHDIGTIIEPKDMLKYADDNDFELCEAERRFPFLLHQRISRVIANEYFGIIDTDILSSIECHTTLKTTPDKYEMALFVADKLAWDQEGTPPFYDDIKSALNDSLEKACYVYMSFMNDNGKVLFPHTNWTLGYESIKEKVVNQ